MLPYNSWADLVLSVCSWLCELFNTDLDLRDSMLKVALPVLTKPVSCSAVWLGALASVESLLLGNAAEGCAVKGGLRASSAACCSEIIGRLRMRMGAAEELARLEGASSPVGHSCRTVLRAAGLPQAMPLAVGILDCKQSGLLLETVLTLAVLGKTELNF